MTASGSVTGGSLVSTSPGNFVLAGNLEVAGSTTLKGATTLGSSLAVADPGFLLAGNLEVTGATTLKGATTLGSTLDVAGATTLGGTLEVAGAATLKSSLAATAPGVLLLAGDLEVTGATTLKGPLGVTGATTITGATTLGSSLGVAGETTLTGAAMLEDALAVAGATTLGSTLAVTDATTLESSLGVAGSTTLTGAADLGGTLEVAGATTLKSSLGVAGATALSSTLGVTGATTLSSTLGVAGATTVNGLLMGTAGTILSNSGECSWRVREGGLRRACSEDRPVLAHRMLPPAAPLTRRPCRPCASRRLGPQGGQRRGYSLELHRYRLDRHLLRPAGERQCGRPRQRRLEQHVRLHSGVGLQGGLHGTPRPASDCGRVCVHVRPRCRWPIPHLPSPSPLPQEDHRRPGDSGVLWPALSACRLRLGMKPPPPPLHLYPASLARAGAVSAASRAPFPYSDQASFCAL